MASLMDELSGSTRRFAIYCSEQYSIIDLVNSALDGVDHDMCRKWDLTDEQWHAGIFAALEVMRSKQ